MPAPHAILFITKDGNRDDIIKFYPSSSYFELYIVEFTPSDLVKSKYEFTLNYEQLKKYIQSLLDLLRYDSEPFDEIQLTTKMIPSVMFTIADLDRRHVRELIEYNVISALNTQIDVGTQ